MRAINILIMYAICLASCSDYVERSYHASRKTGLSKLLKVSGNIDPAIKPYVELFERYYGGTVRNLDISFDTSLRSFATCRVYWYGRKSVLINPNMWNNISAVFKTEADELYDFFSEEVRQIIIFHELGHCVLNKQHDGRRSVFYQQYFDGYEESVRELDMPSSLMSAEFHEHDIYNLIIYKDLYIRELFGGASIKDSVGKALDSFKKKSTGVRLEGGLTEVLLRAHLRPCDHLQ